MKYLILACLFGTLSFDSLANAKITANYIEPASYNDIENTAQSRAKSIEDFEKSMNDYFSTAATQYLKGSHHLKLDILDVDKAGTLRYDLFPAHRGLRVLKDSELVRIKFNYTLYDDQQNVLSSGEENLRDFININSLRHRHSNKENLRFEKQLVSSWLSKLYQ